MSNVPLSVMGSWGDPGRGTGSHANVAMRVDPVLKNTGLQDVVGGSIVFYDTRVKLVKV